MSAKAPAYLFVYGVLQEGLGDWPFLEGLGLGAPATVLGALYAIPADSGWFAALIPTQARFATIVHGAIHDASQIDIAAIDAFEGAEYARKSISVDGWDGYGDTQADAYVWTAGLPAGAEPVVSGNFAEWLKETGRPAYCG
jgi:gamma-glutamylcyclotransferase (GGCT)/AIG2-like uncharacterized protein YtfP